MNTDETPTQITQLDAGVVCPPKNTLFPTEPAHAHTFPRWTPAEREAINRLKSEKDMSEPAIIRQALRMYQAEHERMMGRSADLGPKAEPAPAPAQTACESDGVWYKCELPKGHDGKCKCGKIEWTFNATSKLHNHEHTNQTKQ